MAEQLQSDTVEEKRPSKRQKVDDAASEPRRKRRTAPSQVRRNIERAKRFKEQKGKTAVQPVPEDSSQPGQPAPAPQDGTPAAGLPTKRSRPAAEGGRREQGGEAGLSREELRAAAAALLKTRRGLPVAAHERAIREALRAHDVLVLVGETGSGKSTQVPQFLQSEAWCRQLTPSGPATAASPRAVGGCIAVTEPRRVAATTLARRVAREMGSALGRASPASKVGYAVRFDDNSGSRARVKFVTDGLLLQEALRDPGLSRYSAVVVDEVHERGVNVDLLLGLLKKVVRGRREERGGIPLKVVVMSATAEAAAIVKFFGQDDHEADESQAGFERQDVNSAEQSMSTAGADLEGKTGDAAEQSVGAVDSNQKDDANKPKPAGHKSAKDDADRNHGLVTTLEVGGRQHPVRIIHSPRPVPDILEASMLKIFELNFREPMPGDILVFMTGQSTVESLCTLIQEYGPNISKSVPQLLALPLYAALPQEAQQRVFEPIPAPRKGQRWTRKVIVSTNIAETSITIPGVRYVVDGGKEKVKQYRPNIGLESLLTKPISRSGAVQRAGRAGREAAGICYRLYKQDDFDKLPASSVPEILRCDLSQAFIFLLARGVAAQELSHFPLIARPSRAATEAALVQLHRLGAIDDGGQVTKAGEIMAGLPVNVSMANILLQAASPEMNCLDDAIDLVSAMSGEEIFISKRETENSLDEDVAAVSMSEFRRLDGDHAAMIRAVQGFAEELTDRKVWAKQHGLNWRALREIMRIRKQLIGLAPRLKAHHQSHAESVSDSPGDRKADSSSSDFSTSSNLLRCLLAGFPSNVALLDNDNRYHTAGTRQEIAVHPSSALHGQTNQSVPRKAGKPVALVYSEFVYTSRAYARGVSAIDPGLVLEHGKVDLD